ncbi:MAG: cation:proton antiporter [Nitritalea sp.]
MLLLADIYDTSLPLSNPVLRFLIILIIILVAPLLLQKIKIPPLLGLIIAGAIVGPNGFYLLDRDSSIILSGTAGLLYIMFLAGLEIDLMDFKKNVNKSLVFGLFTFLIPMVLGTSVSYFLFAFSLPTSVLLASMFASHTLIAYPLISKLGVAKNKAVNVTVGGTMITDTLALLVLAVIVGMSAGEVDGYFWGRLGIALIVFSSIIIFLFPLLARWFFKKVDDSVAQYIFVLVMVFLGAVLAELAGIEAIIGAFLSGLALNRLIPHTSPLMNRIEFVGNAIFIPFFLIGVGMLIDYKAFFKDVETIKVGTMMILVATLSKFLAAFATQKVFKFSVDERHLIFGLSNAQAAATLAAVLVGFNIILGTDEAGNPIRLLNESILNGTILMILVTCTIASFVAQKGARNIALQEVDAEENEATEEKERILIPVSNQETTEELVNLGLLIKSKKNTSGLYALSVVNNNDEEDLPIKNARKILEQAVRTAAASDNKLRELLRYDLNIVNGINSVVKEHAITDLILGLHVKKGISDSFLGHLTKGILTKCNTTTFIYKPAQPLSTIKRLCVVLPGNVEREIGFPFWLVKIWNISKNSGSPIVFYGTEAAFKVIRTIQKSNPIEASYKPFTNWEDFLILSRELKDNDQLVLIMSRKEKISYHAAMAKIPYYLNSYFTNFSYLLVYPMQRGVGNTDFQALSDPSLGDRAASFEGISETLTALFRKNR